MTLSEAFKILINKDIWVDSVPNSEYLYEIEGQSGIYSEEEIIEMAKNLNK